MRKRQRATTQCRQEPASRPRTSGRVPSGTPREARRRKFVFWFGGSLVREFEQSPEVDTPGFLSCYTLVQSKQNGSFSVLVD